MTLWWMRERAVQILAQKYNGGMEAYQERDGW
jgi:hypothetical protein